MRVHVQLSVLCFFMHLSVLVVLYFALNSSPLHYIGNLHLLWRLFLFVGSVGGSVVSACKATLTEALLW